MGTEARIAPAGQVWMCASCLMPQDKWGIDDTCSHVGVLCWEQDEADKAADRWRAVEEEE